MKPAPVAGEKEDESKVVFAYDPGTHTRPISALGFTKDQSKLVTVGWDYSIQIWSATTGERLDILRLPAYGRDNGFDSNRWNQAVVSADGATVAIGGGPKLLHGDKENPTRLLIVDVVNKRVRKLNFPPDPKSAVTSLSFSADANRLAVGFGGTDKSVYILDGVQQILKNPSDAKLPFEPALVVKGMAQEPSLIAASPSGNKLLIEELKGSVRSYDVTGMKTDQWKKLGDFNEPGQNNALEWSPDETQFARSWRRGQGAQNTGIQLRTADGKLIKNWTMSELKPGLGKAGTVGSIRYLDGSRLFVSVECLIEGEGRGCVGVVIDTPTGIATRRFAEEAKFEHTSLGAVSPNGTLAASTTHQGLEAVIYNLTSGKIVARCGTRTPFPTIVGWAKDSKNPAIAWSDDGMINPFESKLSDLKYGFDLAKLEPLAKIDPNSFNQHRLTSGEWELVNAGRNNNFNSGRLNKAKKEVLKLKSATAITLIPKTEGPPLIASGVHDDHYNHGGYACLWDTAGKLLAELLPSATKIWDLVPSPDGRYLLASTSTHRLSIYSTDGSRFPILNLVRANGEWVCWTPEGYYAASPGGEKMIGWAENKGPNEFAVFHTAEKFAKQFRRPDIIKLALEKGSLKEALEALKTETPEVETILPPGAKIELIEQRGANVKVKATASSGSKEKPILAMRVLLDGRPFPGGQGVWEPVPGKPAEGVFELAIPGGLHELKVLARNEDGSTVSQSLSLRGPKEASAQPTIHRICVGINDYDDAGLKLGSAAKDAEAMFVALGKYCVGTDNRFGTAKGELILNKEAKHDRLLKAIADVRKVAKPGDLVVLFFAGHGIKQGDDFFLVTREGDPSKSLKGVSISGDELKKTLAEMECPVLMILDACHSAASVKAFRPATDDLTRSLTDDSVGVTILSAAMSHETAGATAENGFFTAGLLKGLQAGEGIPYDPYEKQLYVHHLYSVAYSEVRKATNGKQNPFLNTPWTVPPIPVRDLPVK